MALVHKFVANKKEFKIVSLASFIVISCILLLLTTIAAYNWIITILGILICHTAMCSGDFGLLSYFEYHKDKEVVTYDNVEEKNCYFYGRIIERKTTAS